MFESNAPCSNMVFFHVSPYIKRLCLKLLPQFPIYLICWLIYCDKEGIGDNIFYIKTNFICNLQHAFELFGNGSWVFQNSLNAGDSGVLWPPGPLTKTLPWIHFGPCNPQAPNIIFRFSSFGNFHPCFCHHQEQQDLIYLLELHVY